MKKIVTCVLTVSMLVCVVMALSLGASAATYTDANGYEWEYEENADTESCTITGVSAAVTKLEIPSEIDGKAVTHIGDEAFRDCTGFETAIVPAGVVSIGSNAFNGSTILKKVYFEGPAPSFGDNVFDNTASDILLIYRKNTGWGDVTVAETGKLGDINDNGRIDAQDITMLRRIILGRDFNGNGRYDTQDMAKLYEVMTRKQATLTDINRNGENAVQDVADYCLLINLYIGA